MKSRKLPSQREEAPAHAPQRERYRPKRPDEALVKDRPASAFLTKPLRDAFDEWLERHKIKQADAIRWMIDYTTGNDLDPWE